MADPEVQPMTESDEDVEAEEYYTKEEEEQDDNCFAIGTVVFPVDQKLDFIDPSAVLVNPIDSYIGKYVGQFLSEKGVGSSNADFEVEEDEYFGEDGPLPSMKQFWKVLGVFKDSKSEIPPWLWAVVQTEDYEAYVKEAMKCSVIIYDITANPTIEKFDEIRAVLDALVEKVPTMKTRRVFILISSLHSWSHTPPPERGGEDGANLSEEDYRFRRTQPCYRDLQLLERYVVASGKMTRGCLKAYVIGAGAVYGTEEGPLHHWFKSAWHNAKYLSIYGSGKNYLPTVYIKDLASVVQSVMDETPMMQRYILAVDPFLCQQDQIVKAISQYLGTGHVKRVPEEDIYVNRDLTTFQADQLLLDLRIETTFCKENFNIEFTAEDGVAAIMRQIIAEYKKARHLEPLKVCILGPPGAGKSLVSREIAALYRLHYFDKEEMVRSTVDLLREIAAEQPETEIEEYDERWSDRERDTAKKLLAEVDISLGPPIMDEEEEDEEEEGETEPLLLTRKSMTKLGDDIITKLFRWRLLTNESQNQGFILDGYPETNDQARMLFSVGEETGEEFMGEGEEGKEPIDRRLLPDKFIMLEASDGFLTNRLLTIPADELLERHQDSLFPEVLEAYRVKNDRYENTVIHWLDLQEIVYFPIDIGTEDATTCVTQQCHTIAEIVARIQEKLGKPHNYGLTPEQEEALRNCIQLEVEDYELNEYMESKEMEARRANIQEWMEKLAKMKREEFEREEAALIPLRHYLMAHVVPTLTKGLVEVTRVRPFDPVEFLAEFLFQHNPGSINNATAQLFQEELTKKKHEAQNRELEEQEEERIEKEEEKARKKAEKEVPLLLLDFKKA